MRFEIFWFKKADFLNHLFSRKASVLHVWKKCWCNWFVFERVAEFFDSRPFLYFNRFGGVFFAEPEYGVKDYIEKIVVVIDGIKIQLFSFFLIKISPAITVRDTFKLITGQFCSSSTKIFLTPLRLLYCFSFIKSSSNSFKRFFFLWVVAAFVFLSTSVLISLMFLYP